jgi:hypothetical protein
MATAGRKIGVGIASAGMVLVAAGVFAGGASAQQSEGQERLECPASSMFIDWLQGAVDIDEIQSDAGQSISDGSLTVTLSNAQLLENPAEPLLRVIEVDVETSSPVDAVELVLWQSPGVYAFTSVTYEPAATSDHLVSPDGSHPELGQAPIKGLIFCYEKPVTTTSTTTSTTTTTTSTTVTVAPDQVVATTTTTAAPVEVLPQVVTAPQQIAFTGSSSGPLVGVGAVLVLLGLGLVGIDRLGFTRRGRHAR